MEEFTRECLEVDKDVNPYVVEALRDHAIRPERIFSETKINGSTLLNGLSDSPDTTSETASMYGNEDS